ncbi:MAG: 6-phosphofructokinase [Acidobacteriota bacterium]|nr:6-phosphofructokinase [Acidobacteriota bacterium]MDE3170232.1 6-phosphofructokinase [Acidobacteriota bacterium]
MRVAVLTTGGDAPGINAAIRAAVRTGIDKGWEMFGVRHGYSGLLRAELIPLGLRDVSGIVGLGGTVLGSIRFPEFKREEVQLSAIRILCDNQIDAAIVIGGDGSQAGALALAQKNFPIVGIASTIDNDLFGSEITIGVDTALNVALEAIDRIKVTASSHERAFLVEVMGRNCGYLALMAGIAGGAEAVALPEVETDPEALARSLRSSYERGKHHAIVVVAEGARFNAEALTQYFREHRERLGFELRDVKLGHVQRGGTPGAFDRLLGTRFAAAATEHVARKQFGVLIGLLHGEVASTPLSQVVGKRKLLDPCLLKLAGVLAQ